MELERTQQRLADQADSEVRYDKTGNKVRKSNSSIHSSELLPELNLHFHFLSVIAFFPIRTILNNLNRLLI